MVFHRKEEEEEEKVEAALWSVEGVCLAGKWVDDDAEVFATRRSLDTSCRVDPCA